MKRAADLVRREIRADLVVAQIVWREVLRLGFCSWWGHNWEKHYFQGRHSGHGYMVSCRLCKDFRVPYRVTS